MRFRGKLLTGAGAFLLGYCVFISFQVAFASFLYIGALFASAIFGLAGIWWAIKNRRAINWQLGDPNNSRGIGVSVGMTVAALTEVALFAVGLGRLRYIVPVLVLLSVLLVWLVRRGGPLAVSPLPPDDS